MRYRYYTADVFTDRIFGGNPLAVFPEAEGLSPEQMQRVARELNISETVFVLPADSKDHLCRLRIFTPAMELPFAGHPTLGAAHVLAVLGEIEVKSGEAEVIFEEGIGPITVRITADGQLPTFTQLSVAKMPEHAMEIPSLRSIASALSLDISDLLLGDDRPMAVSCGVPFLIVPLRNLESLGRAKLDRETWENTLQDSWAPHIYAFAYEAETEGADLRARMFAPAMGIEEDPATGAAASALAGYLSAQEKNAQGSRFWTLEQGFEMGRPSLLKVEAEIEAGQVTAIRVGGASVLVSECQIEIPEPGAAGGLVLEPATEAPAEPKAPPMEPLPQAVAKPKADAEDKEKEEAAKPETKKDDEEIKVSDVKDKAPEAKAAPPPAEDEAPDEKAESPADEEAKPSPPCPPAAEDAAESDKVVPLRSVLKALTSDSEKEPKQEKQAEPAPEPAAANEAETPEETSEPKRPMGFVVEPKPDTAAKREEKKPDEAPATEERASKLSSLLRVGPFTDSKTKGEKPAANGKAPAADDPAGDTGKRKDAKASVSIRVDDGPGRSPESFEDEENAEDSFDDVLEAFGEEAETDGPEPDEDPGELDDYDEEEAYDEDDLDEDDEDDEEDDEPEDEDSLSAEQFKNQKHYKFLWSGTLRHGDQIYGCVIIDLSSKAALVQLEEELAYDLTLNFDSPVTLKNEKIGRLKGEVVWREKNRLGVELLEDPKEVVRILEAARK